MNEITPDDIFFSLPQRFKADKAGNYTSLFHFELSAKKSGEAFLYTVRIENGACTVNKGLEGTAKCVVKSSPQTYTDLTLGKGNPQTAILTGKVKVSNLAEMMSFAPLFAKFEPGQVGNISEIPALKGTASRKPDQGPLQRLRVLDLTRLLPGPLGTMMMADMGAEVIKIESPGFHDYTRDFPPHIGGESAGYLAFNRSKRSLALDYSQAEGKAVLLDLVKTADIFIEQFRPGVMQKMGLGYEDLKQVNPRLIYVSVTGYGQTGPYAQLAGHDLNYITYAGVLAGNQNEAPQVPLVQMADIAGGSYMSIIACLSALYARQQTGQGQWVDVSMMDGVMPLAANASALYWATGQDTSREASFLSGGLLNYGIYPCKDERYITLGTLEAKFWTKFCDVIGKPEWKNRMMPMPPEHLKACKEELTEVLKTKTSAEWTQIGMENDLLINTVYDTPEVEQDPQVKAREMVVEMEHPTAGKIKGIGVPLKFSDTQARPAWPAPLMGEDTLAILKEVGLTEERIQTLVEKKILKCTAYEKTENPA